MAPMLKSFDSLRQSAFRFYLGSQMCYSIAVQMRILAQSLLIYRLTGSVALLGVMALVNALPGILLPLIGGVIADRLPKKNVLFLGQMGTLVTTLAVALSLTLGILSAERAGSWWIIVVASFISNSAYSLSTPSRQAIVVELVGADQVMNAISLRTVGYNIVRLGAPALAGVLLDALGFEFIYYLGSGVSFIALILTLFLPLTGTFEGKGHGAVSQLKDGLRYVRGEANVLFVLSFAIITALLAAPHMRLLPVFVDDILKVGATGMGMLLSAAAIGALVGSSITASLPSKKRGALLLIGTMVLGLALTFFAFSRNWHFSLVFIAVVSLGQSVRMILSNTLLQSYTDSGYLGRVMSVYALTEGVASLGVFVAAILAESFGVPLTVGGFALTMVLLSLLAMVFLPRIRKLD